MNDTFNSTIQINYKLLLLTCILDIFNFIYYSILRSECTRTHPQPLSELEPIKWVVFVESKEFMHLLAAHEYILVIFIENRERVLAYRFFRN